METLQSLATIIKDLPDTAIWIIAIYFFFKLAIVGSIYGVIRLAIIKLHDVLVTKNKAPTEVGVALDGRVISRNKVAFLGQIDRISAHCNEGTSVSTLHSDATTFLRKAIDSQIEKEKAGK